MRNIFPTIFTAIATPVRSGWSGAFVTGERINAPSQFPCVMVVEADNYEDTRDRDNSLTEVITTLMYEITVFSNKSSGKRSQCVEIMQAIDDVMKSMNGTRIARVEGYFDSESTIYMMKCRYRLKTDGTYTYAF